MKTVRRLMIRTAIVTLLLSIAVDASAGKRSRRCRVFRCCPAPVICCPQQRCYSYSYPETGPIDEVCPYYPWADWGNGYCSYYSIHYYTQSGGCHNASQTPCNLDAVCGLNTMFCGTCRGVSKAFAGTAAVSRAPKNKHAVGAADKHPEKKLKVEKPRGRTNPPTDPFGKFNRTVDAWYLVEFNDKTKGNKTVYAELFLMTVSPLNAGMPPIRMAAGTEVKSDGGFTPRNVNGSVVVIDESVAHITVDGDVYQVVTRSKLRP